MSIRQASLKPGHVFGVACCWKIHENSLLKHDYYAYPEMNTPKKFQQIQEKQGRISLLNFES